MQDQVLESLDSISRSGDVDELLSLLLRSSHSSQLQHILEEVGHAENGSGTLSSSREHTAMSNHSHGQIPGTQLPKKPHRRNRRK